MLRGLTSRQLTEIEAFLIIEASPGRPEMERELRDQQMKDVFSRFKKRPKPK